MEYMIRFTQIHETFRLAEIEALAVLEKIDLEILSYSPTVSKSSVDYLVFPLITLVTFLLRQTALRRSCHQTGQKKHSCQGNL